MTSSKQDLSPKAASPPRAAAGSGSLRLSTADVAPRRRHEWLCEVIGREYSNVDIRPPAHGDLFNEMQIAPWRDLQMSTIRSHAIALTRRRDDGAAVGQDAYFLVVLTSGRYRIEQAGREAFLQPGDMTLYDAARWHRVECPDDFGKIIVSIPRDVLRRRLPRVDSCCAVRIPGDVGVAAVTAGFIRSAAAQLGSIERCDAECLSAHALDLVTMAIAAAGGGPLRLQRSRDASKAAVTRWVEINIANHALDAASVAAGVGLSARYINRLFERDGLSLMRYVWKRRLCLIREDLAMRHDKQESAMHIAHRRGFNDPAHFSRAFKAAFGMSPTSFRRSTESSDPDRPPA